MALTGFHPALHFTSGCLVGWPLSALQGCSSSCLPRRMGCRLRKRYVWHGQSRARWRIDLKGCSVALSSGKGSQWASVYSHCGRQSFACPVYIHFHPVSECPRVFFCPCQLCLAWWLAVEQDLSRHCGEVGFLHPHRLQRELSRGVPGDLERDRRSALETQRSSMQGGCCMDTAPPGVSGGAYPGM